MSQFSNQNITICYAHNQQLKNQVVRLKNQDQAQVHIFLRHNLVA
jgi:hypothetical protein